MSKYIELARKLRELAERGVGGEADNAKMQLDKIMKLHNISPEQLEGVEMNDHPFDQKGNHDLFAQVAVSVVGNRLFEAYSYKGKRDVLYINCTEAEFVEISAKFEFHKKEFKTQSDIFFRSYIFKHGLMNFEGKSRQLDEDDKSALRMAEAMQSNQYRKQLGEGNK